MKIVSCKLKNWKRFRGEHEVMLGGGVHAVVAEDEKDTERSNWIGKSSLLQALGPFPLFGEHGMRTEDEWIANGEEHGFVELDLGSFLVRRERHRGGVTKLTVDGKLNKFEGDGAQDFVLQQIGLTRDDFYAWCFVEQKRMARFVEATPGKRQEVVSDWLNLGPLERAGTRAQKRLNAAALELDVASSRPAQSKARFKELVERRGAPVDTIEGATLAWFETAIAGARIDAERVRGAAKRLEARDADWREWAAKRDAHDREMTAWEKRKAERDSAVARIGMLTERRNKLTPIELVKLSVDRAAKVQRQRELVKEQTRLNELMRGQFSGTCPVSPGFVCPAKDEINGRREAAKVAVVAASNEENSVSAQIAAVDESIRKAMQVDGERVRLDEEIARATGMVDVVLPEKPAELGPGPEAVATYEVRKLEQEAREHEQRAAALEAELGQLKFLLEEIATGVEQQQAAERTVRVWRAASLILGRQGAQRRVAERGLRQIEADANGGLREAGIDLRVTTTWARPTKQPAEQCDQCGCPYPRTAKAKRCERCGAERGPEMDERLDLELSNRSGGAEDLAGGAYQLSAGAWLRARRSTPWSVAYLDEPFGSLDAAHRRQFARYLTTVLMGRYAMEQAFVVAHHAGIMDAMPRRIVVTGSGRDSRVRVD